MGDDGFVMGHHAVSNFRARGLKPNWDNGLVTLDLSAAAAL